MTTYVSLRLNIVCFMLKIRAYFSPLCVPGGISLTSLTASLNYDRWLGPIQLDLAQPHVIEVHVPSQESERSYRCIKIRDVNMSGIQYSSTRNRYSRVLEYSEDTSTF